MASADYHTRWRREYVLMPTYYLPAKSLGSHASGLISMLRQGAFLAIRHDFKKECC